MQLDTGIIFFWNKKMKTNSFLGTQIPAMIAKALFRYINFKRTHRLISHISPSFSALSRDHYKCWRGPKVFLKNRTQALGSSGVASIPALSFVGFQSFSTKFSDSFLFVRFIRADKLSGESSLQAPVSLSTGAFMSAIFQAWVGLTKNSHLKADH